MSETIEDQVKRACHESYRQGYANGYDMATNDANRKAVDAIVALHEALYGKDERIKDDDDT